MFEFHGWFVVAETPEDQDEGGLDQILADLRTQCSCMCVWRPSIVRADQIRHRLMTQVPTVRHLQRSEA